MPPNLRSPPHTWGQLDASSEVPRRFVGAGRCSALRPGQAGMCSSRKEAKLLSENFLFQEWLCQPLLSVMSEFKGRKRSCEVKRPAGGGSWDFPSSLHPEGVATQDPGGLSPHLPGHRGREGAREASPGSGCLPLPEVKGSRTIADTWADPLAGSCHLW